MSVKSLFHLSPHFMDSILPSLWPLSRGHSRIVWKEVWDQRPIFTLLDEMRIAHPDFECYDLNCTHWHYELVLLLSGERNNTHLSRVELKHMSFVFLFFPVMTQNWKAREFFSSTWSETPISYIYIPILVTLSPRGKFCFLKQICNILKFYHIYGIWELVKM